LTYISVWRAERVDLLPKAFRFLSSEHRRSPIPLLTGKARRRVFAEDAFTQPVRAAHKIDTMDLHNRQHAEVHHAPPTAESRLRRTQASTVAGDHGSPA